MTEETQAPQAEASAVSGRFPNILTLALMATASTGLLYFCFFQLTPWIWSHNLPFDPADITPWVLPVIEERDGIELYALYVLMFLNLLLTGMLGYGWSRITGKTTRRFVMLALVVVSFTFFYSAGFHPPMSVIAKHTLPDVLAGTFKVLAVVLSVIATLYYLQKRSARWTLVTAAYLLIPICFVSTQAFSLFDTPYIFAPALHLLHGAAPSEVYIQYDLLPSLLAMMWMKLHLDLNLFQMTAQGAYYLLFLGLFAFSKNWFHDKRLPAFLLAALVLVRIYAGPHDASYIYQVTPFRLDLWFVLLLLIYFKGAHHWSAGLYCGLLILLHKNFGIIYSAAYIQLLLTLSLLDTFTPVGNLTTKSALAALSSFGRSNYRNLGLILAGAVTHYLIFRNAAGQIDFYFQKLGIGFLRIATDSFYWYVAAVMGLSFALLLKLRNNVAVNYFSSGLCLLYLAIGNSLYFFGRSHENNIINISAILLLLFFFTLDMLGRFNAIRTARLGTGKEHAHRSIAVIVSFMFITSLTVYYNDSISGKAAIQMQNASNGQFIYPPRYSEPVIMNFLAEIKLVTRNSSKVFFVSDFDFLYEYFGGYAPVGYYNPLFTWISLSELNKFLDTLISQGYYLVIEDRFTHLVHLSGSGYYGKMVAGRLVVWKK